MIDRLINGKSGLEKIVSIEPNDEYSEIFLQKEEAIEKITVPNKYWILSDQKLDKYSIRLKGDLHYKWGNQYNSRKMYYASKRKFKEADTYSIYNPKESQMVKDGYVSFLGLNPKDVSILSFDLETTGLNPYSPDAQILLISTTYRYKDKIVKKLFSYDEYDGEDHLIWSFSEYLKQINPSIILGHNIVIYDFPYILGRCDVLQLSCTWGRNDSPIEVESYESKFRVDGTRDLHYHKIKIYGREIVDSLFLAYKYDIARKYESYGLKGIIRQEGLEKANRTFYDASTIRFKYQDPVEWKKIKQYCIDDSDDSLALFDLMISPFWVMARSIPKSFQGIMESASGSQINSMMVRSYLQEGHSIPKATETHKFEGAIVIGNPGIYSNAFKVDVASLYPSIMLEYNVHDKDKDPLQNFSKMLKYFTEHRLYHKKQFKLTGKKEHDDEQASAKILINSFYGFMASTGLNFNSLVNAEFVTRKGREILIQAIEWATGEKYVEKNNIDDPIISDDIKSG